MRRRIPLVRPHASWRLRQIGAFAIRKGVPAPAFRQVLGHGCTVLLANLMLLHPDPTWLVSGPRPH